MTEHLEQENHTPIAPAVMVSRDCTRLGHPVVELAVRTGDRVTACRLCTYARRAAIDAGKSEEHADALVQRLRAETEPYPGDVDLGGVGAWG